MEYRERLEKAIDYAIESEYAAWCTAYKILDRINGCENLCLYGAGKFFKDIRDIGYFKNCIDVDIKYICDNNVDLHGSYIKTNIDNAKVISFEELKKLNNVVVIITVGNPFDIEKQLLENNIENYRFGDLVLNSFTPHYSKEFFIENKEKILKVYDLLEDDKSREVYTETLCNRIAPHLAKKYFVEMQEENEYFLDVLNIEPEKENIVDCGAYIGDSLEVYMNMFNNKIGKYYCLELNDVIADICQHTINKYNNKNIELIRAGVSDENKIIKIANTGEEMSSTKIESNNLVDAKIVRIDDEFKDKKITLIKMDIEGEEILALKGAENIIRTQKPKLGISAYHILSDMWEIPLLIKKYCNEYRIYYRHHNPVVWDTDCYAIV